MKEKRRARGFWVSYGNGEGVVAVHICGKKKHYLWSKLYSILKAQEFKRKMSCFWQTMHFINSQLNISGQKKQNC